MKPILFTSLAPRNLAHQLSCMATWRPHVSTIISINHQAELSSLSGLPDWVRHYTYDDIGEDGRFHVPLHRFGEAIDALAQPTDPVVLCNSDISVRQPAQPLDAYADTDGLRFMSRIDVHDGGKTHKVYDEGFDVFFFQAKHHELLSTEPFRFGLPWWDFFLPLNFLHRGFTVQRLSPTFAYHQTHTQNWDQQSFDRLGHAFMKELYPQFVKADYREGEILHVCGMVRHLLVSRRPGEPLTASDLQRLHRRLAARHGRRGGLFHRLFCGGFRFGSARRQAASYQESAENKPREQLPEGQDCGRATN